MFCNLCKMQPIRVHHTRTQGEPPNNVPAVRVSVGRYQNHHRPRYETAATAEELHAALLKYQREYVSKVTAPHLALRGHLLVCDCDGRSCHAEFIAEVAAEYEHRQTLQNLATVVPSTASASQAATAREVRKKEQGEERSNGSGQPVAPYAGDPGAANAAEQLGRVQMAKRAGVSVRTLDTYRAEGHLSAWYIKGKNRVMFDAVRTLEQIASVAKRP